MEPQFPTVASTPLPATPTPEPTTDNSESSLLAIAVHPSQGYSESLLLLSRSDSVPRVLFSVNDMSIVSPEWSHDGNRIAFIQYPLSQPADAVLSIFSLPDQQSRVIKTEGAYPSHPRWTAGDSALLTTLGVGFEAHWVLIDPDTHVTRTLPWIRDSDFQQYQLIPSPTDPIAVLVGETKGPPTGPAVLLVALDRASSISVPLPASLPEDCVGPRTEPAWAPDGSSFAVQFQASSASLHCQQSLWIYTLSSESWSMIEAPEGYFPYRIDYAPSDRLVAWHSKSSAVVFSTSDLATVCMITFTEDSGVTGLLQHPWHETSSADLITVMKSGGASGQFEMVSKVYDIDPGRCNEEPTPYMTVQPSVQWLPSDSYLQFLGWQPQH